MTKIPLKNHADKTEKIEEIDQFNAEIASEEKHTGSFEPKIEAKDIIKYSKEKRKSSKEWN